MIMIPTEADERELAIAWFIEDIGNHRLSAFEGDAMLAQLRLAGDVVNLERVSRVLSHRGHA